MDEEDKPQHGHVLMSMHCCHACPFFATTEHALASTPRPSDVVCKDCMQTIVKESISMIGNFMQQQQQQQQQQL